MSNKDGSARVVRLHVDAATSQVTGLSALSTAPVDNPLSTDALNAHAEAMRNELLTRLLAERYSFPTWFRKP